MRVAKGTGLLGRSVMALVVGAVLVSGPAASAATVAAYTADPSPSSGESTSASTSDASEATPDSESASPSDSPSAADSESPSTEAPADPPSASDDASPEPDPSDDASAEPDPSDDASADPSPAEPSEGSTDQPSDPASDEASEEPEPSAPETSEPESPDEATPVEVDVPGINVIAGDRLATIQWPDFGPETNYVVQLEQPDGTWEPQDVDVVRATEPIAEGSAIEAPAEDVDRQATLDGLKNDTTYRARIVSAPTLAEAEAAIEPAFTEQGGVKGGAAAQARVRSADTSATVVSTAPIMITPMAVPDPGATESVITVKVGGDRSGQTGVTALAGVTLQLYNGGAGGPTTAVPNFSPTRPSSCVSDADGDCSFIVPNTATGAGQNANRDRQFWIQRTGSPSGWFGIDSPRVGLISGPTAPEPYTFRTGTQLRGNTIYYSSGPNASFMLSTGAAEGNDNASGGIWQTSRANPTFPAQCGADVALILDLSGSVGGAIGNLRTAAQTFVSSLVGTPSRVGLFTFASTAPANGGGNVNRPLTSVSTSAATVNGWIAGVTVATTGQATNWDRAFAQVAANAATYDVAVVITDGDPTVYGSPAQGPGDQTRFREVENGVFSANAIKAEGTRMIAFGVGSGVSGDSANLRAISGTTANSDYYQTTDYAAAGAALRALALGSCEGSLNVIKMVVPSSAAPGSIAGAVPAGGWRFGATATSGVTVSPTSGDTAASTGALSFGLTFPGGTSTTQVTATETLQAGFTLQQVSGANAVCTRLDTSASVPVTNSGATGFTVTASDAYGVSCRVYNRAPAPAASLQVTKRWIVNDIAYDDPTQPEGLAAQLRLAGVDSVWGTEYGGYQAGQSVSLSEVTTINRGQCTLTSSRLTNNNGTPVDLPLAHLATLGAGLNTYQITNVVTCPTRLTLTKTVQGGAVAPTAWSLTATAPAGALAGPSGTTGATAPVTPDARYVLAESTGDPRYVQRVAEGAVAIPGSTISWFCSQIDDAGNVIPGFSDGLNGGVQVPVGYHVRCNVVNETAQLRLVKVVEGGTAVPADWDLTATPTGANVPAGLDPVTVEGASLDDAIGFPVRPGQPYLVEETGPAGYHADPVVCVVVGSLVQRASAGIVTPQAGEDLVCTFTNVRDTARLTLVKTVTNNNGGTAVAADWTLSAAGPTPISGLSGEVEVTDQVVDTGTYTLSEEDGPPGYTAGTWACDDGTTGTQVTLELGDDVTCTINNDDQPAQLTLVKTVTNLYGGAAVAADWTLSAAGPTPISGATGSAAVTDAPVSAGSYTLGESGPAGYQGGPWSCVGGTQSGSSVSLALGESAVCTITNADLPAHLTLVKTVTNNNGGSAVPTDWTLSAAGPTPITGATGTAAVTDALVAAGSYTLSETPGPSGYLAGSWSCEGGTLAGSQLTLALGESAVCTINNDDQPAHLTLVKTVTNDNGGTAEATDWTLEAEGPTPGITGAVGDATVTNVTVDAGDYDLSERDGPTGYTPGAWSCDAGTLVGSTVSIGVGQSVICRINNDDQPALLTLVKTVTNDHGGTAEPADWLLSATGPSTIEGRTDEDAVTEAPVNAGTYQLDEAGGPTGYARGEWSCTGGSLTGSELTLGVGQAAACTINNNDLPARLTLIKVVDPADSGSGRVPSMWTLTATPDGIAGQPTVTGNGDPTSSGGVADVEVFAGDYGLDESGPAGFTPGSWVCEGGVLAGETVTVPSGGYVVCRITNTAVSPTLTLVKIVDNGNTGATFGPADWNLVAVGPTPINGASGAPSVTAARVQVGTYDLDESGPSGYTRSAWVCTGGASTTASSVTLTEGQNATCTIINTAIAPRLTLVKLVDNQGFGTALPTAWTLQAASPETTITGATGTDAVTSAPVTVGTYALTESGGPPGYVASAYTCVGGTPAGTDQVALAVGDTATCTITNTLASTTITLRKAWVNGVAPDSAALTIDGTNDDSATSTAPDVPTAANSATITIYAGEPVDLTETLTVDPTRGYTPVLTCDRAGLEWQTGAITGTFTASTNLAELLPTTCTFTNTRTQNPVTLQKEWIDGYADDTAALSVTGGLTDPAEATSTATGAPGSEVDSTNTATTDVLSGETVGVSEVLDGNGAYTSAWVCRAGETTVASGTGVSGSFTMPNAAVVCTITNTRTRHQVALQKEWIDGHAGDTAALSVTGGLTDPATATSTASGAAGSEVDSANAATTDVLSGETVGVSEVLASPDGAVYTSAWVCRADDETVASGTGVAGSFTMPDEPVVCTITNTHTRNAVTLRKAWVNGAQDDTADLSITGGVTAPATATSTASGASGTEVDTANAATANGLSGETVDVSEVLGSGNAGTYTSAWVCLAGEQPVGSGTGVSGTFTMPNGPVVCTITNTRTTYQVTLRKEWIDGYAGDTATLQIAGGQDGTQTATSTSTGATGSQVDATNVATATVGSGATVTVGEELGSDNVGEYVAGTVVCTAGGESVTVGEDSTFAMPTSDVDCSITNERSVTPPSPPTVTPGTCDPADPLVILPGSITIPANADYRYFVNGEPYTTGTYPLPPGTYTVTAQLQRGQSMAPSGFLRQLAVDLYTWTVTVADAAICPGLDKVADPPSGSEVNTGDVITYTITVLNAGTDPVVGETVIDTLPGGVELIPGSVQPAATYDADAGTLTWTIDLPGATSDEAPVLELTYQVRVTTDGGTLINTARWVEKDLEVSTEHTVPNQPTPTPTPTPTPPPDLPKTGADNLATLGVTGLLLILGGALVLIGRRRRLR